MDFNAGNFQILWNLVGSGFAAYIGVRVALTKIQTRQDGHDRDIGKLDERMTYVERHLFNRRRGEDE